MHTMHRKIEANANKLTNQVEVLDRNNPQATVNLEAWQKKSKQW